MTGLINDNDASNGHCKLTTNELPDVSAAAQLKKSREDINQSFSSYLPPPYSSMELVALVRINISFSMVVQCSA